MLNKLLSIVILITLTTVIIAGCSVLDIVNANNARDIEIARINANAEITQAQFSAMADTTINTIWASQIPLIVLVASITTIVIIILLIRYKLSIERERKVLLYIEQLQNNKNHNLPIFNDEEYELFQNFAMQNNGTFIIEDNQPKIQYENGKTKLLTVEYD